jgi:NAD(P)-dependent dehydrogenase (short-subunit alcohol dehydrogenase family)
LRSFGLLDVLSSTPAGSLGRAGSADEVMRVFGKVHILCNNTGVGVAGPLKLATYDDWDWVLGVTLGSAINGIRTLLPHILAHGEGGHIINTSSVDGILPHPGMEIYNTAKFAVVGLSESLREELATEDVGVSVLCPGPINTRIHEAEKNRPARFANSGLAETTKVAAEDERQSAVHGSGCCGRDGTGCDSEK